MGLRKRWASRPSELRARRHEDGLGMSTSLDLIVDGGVVACLTSSSVGTSGVYVYGVLKWQWKCFVLA
jgi:hypothetical protein